jgi:hypothetical protein
MILNRNKSPAGVVLSFVAFVAYQIAAKFFEGPFTAAIYSKKTSKNKSKKFNRESKQINGTPTQTKKKETSSNSARKRQQQSKK